MARPRQSPIWAAWICSLCWFGERWRTSAAPSVLSVPAGDFLGTDGEWTPFTFNVGTPPQVVNLFPSTSSSQFLLQAAQACNINLPNCAQARGGVYTSAQSSSWEAAGSGNITLESNLDITVPAIYGSDTINFDGTTLNSQTISENDQTQYWVGTVGLHIYDNTSADGNTDQTDFISSLKHDVGATPSLSFGYTAGASYRLKGVPGSLTFGGYDQSRFDPTQMMVVDFNDSDTRDLALHIATIETTINDTSSLLLPDPVDVLIDTTVTDIWLPEEACKKFESAFKLTWNSTNELYYINSSDHTVLQNENPNITFGVLSPDGNTSMDFVLPYSAFDKTATWPRYNNYPNEVSYFPLRRASDKSQYTLGRAFFQEVYIFVNFENGTFTLSPAVFSTNSPPNLMSFFPNGTSVPSSGSGSNSNSGNSFGNAGGDGSSSRTTAGAAAGATIGALLLAAIAAFLWYRHRRKKRRIASEKAYGDTPDGDGIGGANGANGAAAKDVNGIKNREMNTGIDHEIFEAGSPHSPRVVLPADASELDGSVAPAGGSLVKKRSELSSDNDPATAAAAAAAARARRAELGTSYSGAELTSNYSGAELGSHYSGAGHELEGSSPVMSAVEIASIPSPTLSALRSGTVSPMTAASPGPGSPRVRGLHHTPSQTLGVPSPVATRPGTAAAVHGEGGTGGSGGRPPLNRNPSSTEMI